MLPRPAHSHPTLKVGPDGSFRLAIFCDMHFGESLDRDKKSIKFQHRMIELEKPDLVVIDGDASSNYASPACPDDYLCQQFYQENWLKFTHALEKTSTPYAYTLGNHDRIPGLNETPGGPGFERRYAVRDHWIMHLDESLSPMSTSKDGPEDIHGASNYVLPVLGLDGSPALYIWLLDSSDNNCLGIHGWGCVYPDQVDWFRRTSQALKRRDGKVIPGVMFHHIPLPELNDVWNNHDIEVNGTKAEEICCFSTNTGLFDAIVNESSILAVFHGHDHNNDFIARHEGVVIGFGRKSGYGGYGGLLADRPGSRIMEFRFPHHGAVTWETWIRLETGERLEQQPVPPSERPTSPGCCGKDALAVKTDNYDSHIIDANRACRVHDDTNMCRIATGLPPLVPSTAV